MEHETSVIYTLLLHYDSTNPILGLIVYSFESIISNNKNIQSKNLQLVPTYIP